jgi:hypothetical protein
MGFDRSRRLAVDLRLRPRSHWDRQIEEEYLCKISIIPYNIKMKLRKWLYWIQSSVHSVEHLGPCVAERYLTIRFLRMLHFAVAVQWSRSFIKHCPMQHSCNYITQWLSRCCHRVSTQLQYTNISHHIIWETEEPVIWSQRQPRGSTEMFD